MKQNKPIIYLGSGIIGAIIYAILGMLGYNSEAEGVVRAGAFEFSPEMFRNLISVLVPILIPIINAKWPGVGNLIQKLLSFLVPENNEVSENSSPEHASLCNLCKLLEDDARRGDMEQAEIGLKWYWLKVKDLAPSPEPTPDEGQK